MQVSPWIQTLEISCYRGASDMSRMNVKVMKVYLDLLCLVMEREKKRMSYGMMEKVKYSTIR